MTEQRFQETMLEEWGLELKPVNVFCSLLRSRRLRPTQSTYRAVTENFKLASASKRGRRGGGILYTLWTGSEREVRGCLMSSWPERATGHLWPEMHNRICYLLARHGPGNSRPSLIILAGPSPHGKDSRCPHSVLPSQGREQQILSSLETWTGMMNVLEHLSYAESMTENQK